MKSSTSHLPLAASLILAFLISSAIAGPVSHFGALKVCGKNICGEKTGQSTPIFFKGPSLYWSVGIGAAFYQASVVDWFVDQMDIGIIRAAMGIRYYKECTNYGNANCSSNLINNGNTAVVGYYDNAAGQKVMIKNIIDAAILNDIYVIVDWHSHDAHRGTEPSLATAFFTEIANEYKNVPNIIWEVYNEPVGASVAEINSYANNIITALRNAGNNNLVLIGSPQWSQQPGAQASAYGNTAASKNVAFTFHFYAGTHPQSGTIGTSATTAMNNNYAVFATEWGTVNSDGGDSVNASASNAWTTWMDNNKISNCMWSASAVDEGSAMFASGTSATELSTSRLTTNGLYFQTYMGTNKWTAQIPTTHPKGKNVTTTVKDGESVTLSATALDVTGTISGIGIKPEFGEAAFTSNSVTYTTPASGSAKEQVQFTYNVTQNSVTVQYKITVNITERRPTLPVKSSISVSRKLPTRLDITNTFSPSDPSKLALSFKDVSLANPSLGTIAIVGTGRDTLLFTPSASQHNIAYAETELTYSIQNSAGTYSTAKITFKVQNLPPIVNRTINYNCCMYSLPNTAPIGIGKKELGSRDPDGDSIWIEHLHLHNQYPGRLEKVKADSFVYYPEANKTGKIIFLYVMNDGLITSDIGRSALMLTGSGTDIGNLPTPPDEIPGYVPIIFKSGSTIGGLNIMSLGSGKVLLNFTRHGQATLNVYSLSGKNLGTLLNGYQNAGSAEVSLSKLNLQKGVYILRLKQESQIKTIRIIH